MVADRKRLLFTTATVKNCCVLTGYGVLDATTYFQVRNAVIAAALGEPRAIVINVTNVQIAATPTLSAFVDNASDIGHWPDVPVALVCGGIDGQKALRRNAISRRIRVYWDVESALATLAPE